MRHALDFEAVLPIIRRYVVVEEALPEQLRTDHDPLDFAEAFEWMASLLRGNAHETIMEGKELTETLASQGSSVSGYLPSSSQLREMRESGKGAIYIVSIVDPTWLNAFVATLPPERQKQVLGSIKNQQLRNAMMERRASRR